MYRKDVMVCNGVEFRPGDKVRVMRQVEESDPNGMGEGVPWDNCWVADMDNYLGLEFTIMDIDTFGVMFYSDTHVGYAFPLAALDKVEG